MTAIVMTCAICREDMGPYPYSVEKFLGTCTKCRKRDYDNCAPCGNFAKPRDGSPCIYCAGTGNGRTGTGTPKASFTAGKVKYADADAKDTAALYDELTKSFSAKKDYGDQCPCGIHPANCPYHS